MAAVFMARQERFLSKIVFFISILLPGCNSSHQNVLNSADIELKPVNGILYFKGQPYSGEVFSLYPNSADTSEILYFRKGKEHGIWKRFYENGRIREERQFENGFKTNIYTGWWPNGTKKLEYKFRGDEYEGTCREWNMDGRLVKQMNYHRGHEQGSQKVFYDNGSVRSNYVVIDGRRYGLLGTKNCINATDSVFRN